MKKPLCNSAKTCPTGLQHSEFGYAGKCIAKHYTANSFCNLPSLSNKFDRNVPGSSRTSPSANRTGNGTQANSNSRAEIRGYRIDWQSMGARILPPVAPGRIQDRLRPRSSPGSHRRSSENPENSFLDGFKETSESHPLPPKVLEHFSEWSDRSDVRRTNSQPVIGPS